ncbi:MAG: GDP-mannose 4,6-dehydratase, partial [Terriglobia bacterium]
VEDHCRGILIALEKGRLGEKYNIGGRNERTNLQIVDRICACLEEKLPAATNDALQKKAINRYESLKKFVPDRPGHDRRYAIDATKIRTELGWMPQYDFDSGIARTIDWYLENSEWCRKVLDGKYSRERLGLKEESKQ